jgi:hypothetical protein
LVVGTGWVLVVAEKPLAPEARRNSAAANFIV